jgi:ParB-like chromosome segregation protein Spo0J
VSQTANILSSQALDERLLRIPLARLDPHPLNANSMTEERLAKLAANIGREGRYPPLVVRPQKDGRYQLLDGHQRFEALRRLGYVEAVCFPWDCDDAMALVLLSTLNRLEGEDVPGRRASLLAELTALLSIEELSLLLPEDAGALRTTLALLDVNPETLLAEIEAAHARAAANSLRQVSFAVLPEDEADIELAVQQVAAALDGQNRRGRALARICRVFLECGHA